MNSIPSIADEFQTLPREEFFPLETMETNTGSFFRLSRICRGYVSVCSVANHVASWGARSAAIGDRVHGLLNN